MAQICPHSLRTPTRWGGTRATGVAICLAAAGSVGLAADSGPRFDLPSGDLPRIRTRGFDVTFMPNGSFVLAKDNAYLLDGGLRFSDANWKRWGTQIRRSLDSDTYEFDSKGKRLRFKSTVQDLNRRDSFRLEESVHVVPHGLRFDYFAWPVESMILAVAGPVFHGPIAELGGSQCEVFPGFVNAKLPKVKGKMARFTQGRMLVLGRGTKREIEIHSHPPRRWMSFDERRWRLNTFRFEFSCPILAVPFTPEHAVSFSFDLLLGPGRRRAYEIAPSCKAEITPWGGLVVYRNNVPLAFIAPQVRCVGSPQTLWLWDMGTAQKPKGETVVGRIVDENIEQSVRCGTKVTTKPGQLQIDYSLSAEGEAKLQYAFVLLNVLGQPFDAQSVRAFGAKPPQPSPEHAKEATAKDKPPPAPEPDLPGVAVGWTKSQAAEEIALGVGGPLEMRARVGKKTAWLVRQVKPSGIPAFQLRTTLRVAKDRKSAKAQVLLSLSEKPQPAKKEAP